MHHHKHLPRRRTRRAGRRSSCSMPHRPATPVGREAMDRDNKCAKPQRHRAPCLVLSTRTPDNLHLTRCSTSRGMRSTSQPAPEAQGCSAYCIKSQLQG